VLALKQMSNPEPQSLDATIGDQDDSRVQDFVPIRVKEQPISISGKKSAGAFWRKSSAR